MSQMARDPLICEGCGYGWRPIGMHGSPSKDGWVWQREAFCRVCNRWVRDVAQAVVADSTVQLQPPRGGTEGG